MPHDNSVHIIQTSENIIHDNNNINSDENNKNGSDVTGVKPNTCDDCQKSFSDSSKLTKHKITHSDKYFPCSQCPKSFPQEINLKTHTKTHSEEKHIHCGQCQKSFEGNCDRKKHMKIHHNAAKNTSHSRSKKMRRGGKNKNCESLTINLIGANANGLKNKKKSLEHVIEATNSSCVMIQETKLYKKGQINIEGFQAFELIRSDKEGGGLMTAVKEELEPVLVDEGNDDAEILVIEGNMSNFSIRFINAYGPQESDHNSKRLEFFIRLEEEIVKCKDNDKAIIIELDANSKLGSQIIIGDPHDMSKNGELLWDIIERQNLTVVNTLELCEGVITRTKDTIERSEASVIDFVIVCEKIVPFVKRMIIDENKEFVLTKYTTTMGRKQIKQSDHNTIVCFFDIKIPKKEPEKRREIFNFRNKQCLSKFKELTNTGTELSDCFLGDDSIIVKAEKWKKVLEKKKFSKAFKKIRITKKKKQSEVQMKMKLKSDLKRDLKKNPCKIAKLIISNKIKQLDDDLSEQFSAENATKIKTQVEKLSKSNGEMSRIGAWEVKKNICPRPQDPPMAKKDSKGNLITVPMNIKKLYLECFEDRLRNREMLPWLQDLREVKEDLWNRRFELLSQIETPDWDVKQLTKVLKSLKRNKARDPLGWTNELFMPENAGTDLIKSLLLLLNGIKSEQKVPKFLQMPDITAIYKNKGSKNDLENDRGIMKLSTVRSILDKMIYVDKYDVIDGNMSDSNVGARKGRNIRNHLFIVYGIMNSVKQKEISKVDIQIYDISKCFDAMWVKETMNDIYQVSERDNKLSLMYLTNLESHVAINTPFGQTQRKNLGEIEIQGSVLSPLKCSCQMDSIGKQCIEKNENLFTYKKKVGVPPLEMIDDILTFSKCGNESVKMNTYINTMIEMKKLYFGEKKCHKIHIGEECVTCPELKVHNFAMNEAEFEKYLGDILSKHCNNKKNISSKKSKAIGIISTIMSILESVTFGVHYFEIALMLREALFINGVLTNIEVVYGLTKQEIIDLESADKILLRKILNAHSKSATESLHLELGVLRISDIIKIRRIMFLFYILSRPETELLSRFFYAQNASPAKNDWCLSVKENLEELNIEINYEKQDYKNKEKFAKKVKKSATECALKNLLEMKNLHSKMDGLTYSEIKLQPYFKSEKISKKDAQEIFKFRTRMAEVKNNFRGKYEDVNCPACSMNNTDNAIQINDNAIQYIDSQEHLIICPILNENGTLDQDQCYNDLFCDVPEKNVNIIRKLCQAFEKRNTFIEDDNGGI